MSANTMEANNEVFSEPLGLKSLNPGSLRKIKFSSCRLRCLDFIHLVLALTFCNNFNPRKGPRSTAQRNSQQLQCNHKTHSLSTDQHSAVWKYGVSLKSIQTDLLYHKDAITINIADREKYLRRDIVHLADEMTLISNYCLNKLNFLSACFSD